MPPWFGGRAIAQLVSTPPRAAETKEPVTIVGAVVGGAAAADSAAVMAVVPTIAVPAPRRSEWHMKSRRFTWGT